MGRSVQLGAFSLVEVVLALGVVSVALLSVVALLPMGIMSNKISYEETQAGNFLTMLEDDLRGTHPLANSGSSQLFGLKLPYAMSGGRMVANSTLGTNVLGSGYTTGVTDGGAVSTAAQSHYQVSVVYTRIPTNGSLAPVEARLVVNWPSVSTNDAVRLTSASGVKGYVETYVSFPLP